jgi:hypothetical protein
MVSAGARRVCWDRVVSPNSGSHDGGSRAWGSRRRRPARRQTQQCVGRGGAGLQPESVGGLISTPQPRGLANLRGPQPRRALTRQAEEAVKPIGELAAILRRERGKRRRRGSEGLIASCWPKRTGIVKGKNESRGELDGDGKRGFRPAGEDRSCWKRPTGRFIRLTVSPEPEQESPARGHASEDGGSRFGKGLQRAVGRDEQAGSNLGIWCFWAVLLLF